MIERFLPCFARQRRDIDKRYEYETAAESKNEEKERAKKVRQKPNVRVER